VGTRNENGVAHPRDYPPAQSAEDTLRLPAGTSIARAEGSASIARRGLEFTCPSCGASAERSERFCDECGESLAETAKPVSRDPRSYTPRHLAEKILTSRSALEGERKRVTVLFADVKESWVYGALGVETPKTGTGSWSVSDASML
jgi:hypothetical protein